MNRIHAVRRYAFLRAFVIDSGAQVLENAPSLWLTVNFFCLQFERMTSFGLVKNVLSMAMSAASASIKAKDAALLCTCGGHMAALFIMCILTVNTIKLFFAFRCESHLFMVVAWQCAQDISKHVSK